MTYIEAIGIGFPGVYCHTVGNENLYENIIYDSGLPIPDKVTLDQWIWSNLVYPSDWKITVLAFRNRFTKIEKITMDLASIDDPTKPMNQRQLAASIRVDLRDTDNASYIDLTRPETITGVNALETYGLIAIGRANVILTAQIADSERYIK